MLRKVAFLVLLQLFFVPLSREATVVNAGINAQDKKLLLNVINQIECADFFACML